MALIRDVARRLMDSPKPLLLLDTCELINIVQSLKEKRKWLETAVDILGKLTLNPDSFEIVISELVRIEWQQNALAKKKDLDNYIESLDSQIARMHQAWSHLRKPLPFKPAEYGKLALSDHVMSLVNNLMDQAAEISFDDDCKNKAFSRVIGKKQPSGSGQFKDALLVEHYLRLSNLLKVEGYPYRRIFVTSNVKDFSLRGDYKSKDRNDILHPDLQLEFNSCDLEYFVDLRVAFENLIRNPDLPKS